MGTPYAPSPIRRMASRKDHQLEVGEEAPPSTLGPSLPHFACCTYNTCRMAVPTESTTQNITVRLERQTLRKAKVLAAKRNSSISRLLAEQIEALVGQDEAYEQAQRRALALLDRGLHLGGRIVATRDEWHER